MYFRYSDSHNMSNSFAVQHQKEELHHPHYIEPLHASNQALLPLRHRLSSDFIMPDSGKDTGYSSAIGGFSDYSGTSSSQRRSSTNESVNMLMESGALSLTPLHQQQQQQQAQQPQQQQQQQKQQHQVLSMKKRRSGSIKLALRKIFNKKEKTMTASLSSGPKFTRGHEYHKSDSTLTGQNMLGIVKEENFPITRSRFNLEDDYRLRSSFDHPSRRLPFPMNVNGPQQSPYKSSQDNSSERIEQQHALHPSPRRRATMPSIILNPAEAENITRQWMDEDETKTKTETEAKDKDKTESKYEADHNNQNQIQTSSPLIGLAITSYTNSKRKSRSADHLFALAAEHEADQRRRRSEEIQYWRSINANNVHDAYDQESRADSVHEVKELIEPRDSTSTTDQFLHDPSLSSSEELLDTRRASHQSVEAIHRVDQRLSQIELNMAQLANSMQALSGRGYHEQPKSVHSLEQSFADNTKSLSKLQSHSISGVVGLPSSPRHNKVSRSTSFRNAKGESPSPKPRQSPDFDDLQQTPTYHQGNHQSKPASTAYRIPSPPVFGLKTSGTSSSQTIHNFSTPFIPPNFSNSQTALGISVPTAPSSALALSGSQTAHSTQQSQIPQSPQHVPTVQNQPQSPGTLLDHLAPLYAALRYERKERKRLETLVVQMQRDITDLAELVAHGIGGPRQEIGGLTSTNLRDKDAAHSRDLQKSHLPKHQMRHGQNLDIDEPIGYNKYTGKDNHGNDNRVDTSANNDYEDIDDFDDEDISYEDLDPEETVLQVQIPTETASQPFHDGQRALDALLVQAKDNTGVVAGQSHRSKWRNKADSQAVRRQWQTSPQAPHDVANEPDIF